ncbi:DNA translocase FtsK [Synoicihabitans lomoniglobus]|uniref:DNA translocase FtsK n=1 Tax=Synoicihabitans lomoniglobus TaxID=2909285 RepID=A0AAE9ZX53_9BACT|nr:DNA translocase FtsK [Opitutaceae bacterium LMO-M01]WED64148.1 DNA translocase FtsK [Opitutaceae bacterium LMO-M01]
MPATSSPFVDPPDLADASSVAANAVHEGETASQDLLSEDEARLAVWREEMESRIEERATAQARHRDQLEDALDHLQSLRDSAREDTSDGTTAPDVALPVLGAKTEAAAELPAPFTSEDMVDYQKPSLDLLRAPADDEHEFSSAADLAESKRLLQDALDSFAIDAFVHDAIVGPRVTQFRVRPGFGVRVESIAALDKNIALTMSANAVRIQAPIPGENYVGIEIPNRNSAPLTLRGSLENPAWINTTAEIPLMLGVDIAGRHIICDLARAPHALIAGATGSGKSVCISNLILSLIYRFRPDELELVLIDPKIVEFAIYRDLPHLIHPVVTDPKQACQALKWLVREMEHRYEILAEKNVRNLAGYNAKAAKEGFKPLPFMVLVIDELADLMITAPAEIETSIARIAQMSRAVGIHTVLATQRPSVNVITGVIKANYPTRMAFQVSSQVDSRTIIDGKGAESLQGRGDMLYSPPGIGRLQRLQAPFVDDAEIERIVGFLKDQVPPRYRVELRDEDAPGPSESIDGETAMVGADPMIKEALEVITTHGRASTSYLQRRLKIGYNRAASLMEEMEQRRYIGPQVGSNPREVYVQPGDLQFD